MTSAYSSDSKSGDSSSGSSSAGLGDTSTAEGIVASARGERDDFQFGDDRAIANPPNWASQSSHELYNGAVNDNEPGTADELGASWTRQGSDLADAADTLYEAITELSGVWVGEASGAAQGALIGVANASSTAGDAAKAMGKRLHDQAAAAAEVKKMPPPKDFNMDRWLAAGLAGGPAAMAADAKAQRDAADAVQAEQQRYMNAYTKAMTDVDGATPSFGPESIGIKPVAGTSYGSSSGAGVGNVSVGDGGPALSAIGGGKGVGGSAMNLGLGSGHVPGGVGTGSGVPADVGAVANAGLQQPLATGTGHVSTVDSGPGAAAALGTAALGAGLGYAGAKAFGKDKTKDKPGEQPQEPEATDVPADEAAAEGTEAPATPEVPQGAVAGAPAGPPQPQVPQFSQPAPYQAGPQGAPIQLPGQVEFVGPQAQGGYAPSGPVGPLPDVPAPLAEGAQSGAAAPSSADHSATASVAAGSEQQHHGPAAQGQHAQSMAQQQAAAASMGQPMQPMGGAGGASAGAAGAGAVGGAGAQGDHQAASYLIQPDPDDVFGPTEAVTSGVIGEDPEDD